MSGCCADSSDGGEQLRPRVFLPPLDHNDKKKKKLSSTESSVFSFLLFVFVCPKQKAQNFQLIKKSWATNCAGEGEVRLGTLANADAAE